MMSADHVVLAAEGSKKVCRFCANKDLVIDYKNTDILVRLVSNEENTTSLDRNLYETPTVGCQSH